MGNPIHVLLVEDSEREAIALVCHLREGGFEPEWKRVETETNYRTQLAARPDIVFARGNLSKFSALRALALLQETKFDVPFIVISGPGAEDISAECLKSGATDCILNTNLFRAGPVARRALEEAGKRAALSKLEKEAGRFKQAESLIRTTGGTVNDFNNLLTVIQGHVSLLLANGARDPVARESLRQISAAAERATRLTAQFSAIKRK